MKLAVKIMSSAKKIIIEPIWAEGFVDPINANSAKKLPAQMSADSLDWVIVAFTLLL